VVVDLGLEVMTPMAQACDNGPVRRAGPPSLTPPIVWGSISLVTCLVLAALWNVVIVSDNQHLMQVPAYSGLSMGWRWVVLALGCVLFAAILAGLVFFFVSLVQQIRLNRAQQAFIDAMTHELKTPLTSVRLQVQTLQRLREHPDKQEACLRAALEDLERLDGMLDRVLAAASLGRFEAPRIEAVDLTTLLAEIAQEVRAKHQLSTDAVAVMGASCVIESVPGALRTVFFNLVDNAVKYSDEPVRVRVVLGSEVRGRVTVRVVDQGRGLMPNQFKKIFQRFYRVPDSRTQNRAGTGLGLYIVRETLRLLGGKVAVHSEGLGHGSAFVVSLPARR